MGENTFQGPRALRKQAAGSDSSSREVVVIILLLVMGCIEEYFQRQKKMYKKLVQLGRLRCCGTLGQLPSATQSRSFYFQFFFDHSMTPPQYQSSYNWVSWHFIMLVMIREPRFVCLLDKMSLSSAAVYLVIRIIDETVYQNN